MRAHMLAVLAGASLPCAALADDEAALARKLANPIASLISVPLEYDHDRGFGPVRAGHSNYINFQPSIPIRLNEDWNIIARTAMLVVGQNEIYPGAGDQFGFGTTTQSFFLSPERVGPGGLIWGIGPAVTFPASNVLIDPQAWGFGPTAAVLVQPGAWTIGILMRHIWPVSNGDGAANLTETYLQPFVSYTTKDAWTFTVDSEAYYYWNEKESALPFHAEIVKLFKIGDQSISMGPAVRYWAADPVNDAHGWGFRFTTTLLFPSGIN